MSKAKTLRMPLSEDQKEYLQSLIKNDLQGFRRFLLDIEAGKYKGLDSPASAIAEVEAHISKANGLLELLNVLQPQEQNKP